MLEIFLLQYKKVLYPLAVSAVKPQALKIKAAQISPSDQ
jgi:hypothetical protein